MGDVGNKGNLQGLWMATL